MRGLVLTAMLLLLAACRAPQNHTQTAEGGTAARDHFELDYRVWLPPGYEREGERTYPLLVWFHGGGESEWGWGRAGGIGELMLERVGQGELEPFIVVSPSAGAFKPVMRTHEQLLVQQVLPEVRARYRVNGTTVAIGHSMGGLSALIVSLRNPQVFDAVVAASPFLFDTSPWDPLAQRRAYDATVGRQFTSFWREDVERNFGVERFFRQHDPFSLVRAGTDIGFKLLLTSSQDDPLGLYPHNFRLHALLTEYGLEHDWLVQNGVGHGTVEDPRVMNWLNEQALVATH